MQIVNKMKQPYNLLRLYAVFLTLSLIGIILLINIGISNIFKDGYVREAEYDAVGVSQVILNKEKDLFFSVDTNGNEILNVSPENIAKLERRMHMYLAPVDILKIKLFSTGKQIIYSTDSTIIGKKNLDNSNLNAALEGAIVSKWEKRDKAWDMGGEVRYNIELIETVLFWIRNL